MLARTARNADHLELLHAIGLTSLLYAPLTGQGRVQGVIALFMAGSGRRFADEDRAIAVEIARRASLALENARLYREARDAIQARDEFLSIASHELRTPVTAISGVAQVAMRSKERGTLDDARLTRVLEQLMRGSQRLVTLTEDLLDVSRLQTGRFELRPEPLDLQAFASDFVERFSANIGETHRLDLHGYPVPIMVEADPARLEQVLANLLSNAAKYSPTGGAITMIVTRDATSAQVSVRDEGIGWPPDTEEAIFEPFGRAPNASHRQIQGLGLGLYICRQIVERHGGRISATSPGEGLGATFSFWLPTSGPLAVDSRQ
jgi:signal transduction histidine kinase